MHNKKHKMSRKIPDNMENAYNQGQDVFDKANQLDLSPPSKKQKGNGMNIGFGW